MENELRAPRDGDRRGRGRAGSHRGRRPPVASARRPAGRDPGDPTPRPHRGGPGPRPRSLARDPPGEGAARRPGTPRPVRDLVRHRRSATSTPRPTPPASTRTATSAGPASTRSPAASSRRCTGAGSGRCASTPASPPPRRPTGASATSSSRARPGLSVAFDLPTQMGYDSDAPEAEGEVGRVGVPISSLADMAVLLDGLPLGEVSTSMTINATAPILLALYVAAAEAQGVPRAAIGGTTQNDILKEYIARGTYIFPPRPSMRLVTDVFEFCATELPKWNTISISGYHMREAGRDRRPGARLHPGRRDRLCRRRRRARARRRRLRRPAVVLLRRLVRAVRGGRQVPGRPPDVGDDHARAASGRRTRARGSAASTSRPPARA